MKRRTLLLSLPAGLLAASGCRTEPKSHHAEPTAINSTPVGGGDKVFTMTPIGQIEMKNNQSCIQIYSQYAEGLLGLDQWSHVQVLYWFDRNDTPEKRRILRVHPRGNREHPLTGVFACRSPFRPNLIALSVCRILAVEGNTIRLDAIDAMDGTPVLDLKPFTPPDAPSQGVKVPDWARRGPGG
jgi:tRNA-Thr(GGU) m(6)t(6)A37 methyltransferase TsaA